jgi:class 3 adenylate cyclase
MKKIILLLTVMSCFVEASAQDQHQVDSLITDLKKHDAAKKELGSKSPFMYDTVKVNTLNELCQAKTSMDDYPEARKYADEALALAEKLDYKKGVARSYHQIGVIYWHLGDYQKSLENYFLALPLNEQIGYQKGIAWDLGDIGLAYSTMGNLPKTLEFYLKALKINEKLGIKDAIAWNLRKIGRVYRLLSNYPKALEYYSKSLSKEETLGNKIGIGECYYEIAGIYRTQENYTEALKKYFVVLKIYEEIGNKSGIGSVANGIGTVYFDQGNYSEALKKYFEAKKIGEEIGKKGTLAINNRQIGKVFLKEKKYREASDYLKKGLSFAKEIGNLVEIKLNYANLTELYSAQGNFNKALEHYKLYITYRDSINNTETTKKTVALQMNYDFEKKQDSTRAVQEKKDAVAQKEMQKQKLVRNGFMGGFAVVLLFAVVFFTQRNKIKKGKKRSDELLLNILPEEVAEELKAKGSAEAKLIDEVTVLFTDFKGFTQLSEKLSPKELVAEINDCFSAFDHIMQKHGVEKIKTIGDAYMAAGGLPTSNTTHANDVVLAALDIQQFMHDHKAKKEAAGELFFEIRIGVHTGPVVAGIVGVKKFAYDIWGDTVNTASRMESSGEVGKVNISGTTYELVKDQFHFEHRGKIIAKGKGEIDMYFVEARV